MLGIFDTLVRVCDPVNRRECLRLGALAALPVPEVGAAMAGQTGRLTGRPGPARTIIFFSLYGGPAHQDTFDSKPDAPAEVRGAFAPIATAVPGLRLCEHLPRLARLARHFSLVRSLTHQDNGHESALYTLLTGWPHPQPNSEARPAPADHPSYGAVTGVLRGGRRPVPPYVVLGGVLTNGIGQNGGFLGRGRGPFAVEQDAHLPDFRVPGLSEVAVPADRLEERRRLLARLDAERRDAAGLGDFADHHQRALGLLASRELRGAFALEREPAAVRDRYGRHDVGQNLLLARRLAEAGVPAIQVSWHRGGSWDTHANNFTRLKDSLLPRLDQGLSALLEDLDQRGLLDRCLVVACGEFGRTPRVNPEAGRDHWAGCYSALLAGGGVQGGQVVGASDRYAAYPAAAPVGPWDLGATVLRCAGIDVGTELHDAQGRPLSIGMGRPIAELL